MSGFHSNDNDLDTTKSTLSAMETLRLGAAHAYYSVSRALRLDKVSALLQRAELSLDIPVALLGSSYSPAEAQNEAAARNVLAELVQHVHSTLWMTYRSDFTPISAGEGVFLKTDAGWGCTIRSIQMIAAQALVRHSLGLDWRLVLSTNEEQDAAAVMQTLEPPIGLARLLRVFWDVPVASSPLSLHNLCQYGSTCGLFPGRWLGPWTGCRALEAAANASNALLGLQIAVLGGTGGGAPILGREQFLPYFRNITSSMHKVNSIINVVDVRISEKEGLKAELEALSIKDEEEASTIDGPILGDSKDHPAGLLLLVPLVLGIGKLNHVYAPQLRAVLGMPQSVGIVGGKPGSSVYIVGCQGDSVIYLDPHTIQPAACSDGDWTTFHCDVLRTLWMTNLDPSLALGFYCANEAEYRDLCEKLSKLENENAGMPLLCVREGTGETVGDQAGEDLLAMEAASWEEDEMSESCNLEDEEREDGEEPGEDEGERAEEDIAGGRGSASAELELQEMNPSNGIKVHPLPPESEFNASNVASPGILRGKEDSINENGCVMARRLQQEQTIKSAFEDEAENANKAAELLEPSEREESATVDDGASEFVQIADSDAGPEAESEEIVRVAVVSAVVEEGSGEGRVELRIRVDSRNFGAGGETLRESGSSCGGDVDDEKVGESVSGIDSNEEKVPEEQLEEQQQELSKEESGVLVSPSMLRHASSTRSSAWEFV